MMRQRKKPFCLRPIGGRWAAEVGSESRESLVKHYQGEYPHNRGTGKIVSMAEALFSDKE